MARDVEEYIQSCTMCLASKKTSQISKPPSTLRDVTPQPFHTIFMDSVGPLPVTRNNTSGSKNISYV